MADSTHVAEGAGSIPTAAAPRTLAEAGLAQGLLLGLALKFMHLESLETASDLAGAMRLPYRIVVELIEEAVRRKLVQSIGAVASSQFPDIRDEVSHQGHAAAGQALDMDSYLGPAPVNLAAFREQIGKQLLANEVVTADGLRRGLAGLVFPDYYIRKLLPAINDGRTLLMFGPPGNGKTNSEAGSRVRSSRRSTSLRDRSCRPDHQGFRSGSAPAGGRDARSRALDQSGPRRRGPRHPLGRLPHAVRDVRLRTHP